MANSNYKAAIDVIAGRYGNGDERRRKLWAAGFNPDAVQSIVNALLSDDPIIEDQCQTVMEVVVDLTKHDGINLIFKEGST